MDEMDFLSNGLHQLYSELELEEDLCFSSNLSGGLSLSSPLSSSSLSPVNSAVYDYKHFDDSQRGYSEFENFLTNDYGKSFEPFHSNSDDPWNYFMYSSDQCSIDSWENTLLDNFVELPELTDFLPERTPLCNDSCNSFLKESSDNLNKFRPTTITTITSTSTTSSNGFGQKLHEQAISSDYDEEKITFPCTFGNCTKVYAKPAHLKAHLRRHLGDKPYICTWPNCTWKFSRSDELARHKRSHSGIKPYKCVYCTKCFARSDHLAKHRKVHERKMAVNKMKGIFLPTLHQVRPGRRPKNLNNI